jgi:hypothetical protein
LSANRPKDRVGPVPSQPGGTCRSCAHFRNDPAWLERAVPGLASLGSAYAAVRDEDGLCLRHDRFTGARQTCPDRTPAARGPTAP